MLKNIPSYVKFLLLFFFITTSVLFTNYQINKVKAENTLILGERIFKANCAGCHFNGLNAIEKDKPVIGSAKIKSKETLKTFLNNPPPPMPRYTNLTNDSVQLDALFTYLQTLKK